MKLDVILLRASYAGMALGVFALGFLFAHLYPGIPSLWVRDQLDHSTNTTIGGDLVYVKYPSCRMPYLCYPFEYPFLSGVVQFAVNVVADSFHLAYLSHGVWVYEGVLAALFFSAVIVAAFGAAVVILHFHAGTPPWRVLAYYAVLPLVLFQLDVGTDIIQAFLILLSLYYMVLREKRSEVVAALALSAATAVKLLPILTLPAFLEAAKDKRRFALLYALPLAAMFSTQVLLSPHNFLRVLSFESSYGIEGSWLGLIFHNSIINYDTSATWRIGSSAVIRGVKPAYLASALAALAGCVFAWTRRRLPLHHKVFLILAFEVWGLWISPPQFVLNLAVLAPLVLPLRARWVAAYWLASLPATFPVVGAVAAWLGYNTHVYGWGLPSVFWVLLGAAYQFGFLLLALSSGRPLLSNREHILTPYKTIGMKGS